LIEEKATMSENNTIPIIEDELLAHLDTELQESALGFADYLNENHMTPRLWFGPGYWHIPWEGSYLCGIHLYGFNPGAHSSGWVFWFFTGDYNGEADEGVKTLVWEYIGNCVRCVDECPGGVDATIFGKEYANICSQFPVQIKNPDDETLEKIKKLLELWKEIAPRSNGLHVH